jgi:hypothetical protein
MRSRTGQTRPLPARSSQASRLMLDHSDSDAAPGRRRSQAVDDAYEGLVTSLVGGSRPIPAAGQMCDVLHRLLAELSPPQPEGTATVEELPRTLPLAESA